MIDFRGDEHPAAIVEHIDHRKGLRTLRKPAMGCGVQFPQFPNFTALPAAHRSRGAVIRFGVDQTVFKSPATDLGAIDLKLTLAQDLAAGEAVACGRSATQAFAQKHVHLGWPVRSMIASRNLCCPMRLLMMRASLEIILNLAVGSKARPAHLD